MQSYCLISLIYIILQASVWCYLFDQLHMLYMRILQLLLDTILVGVQFYHFRL